MKTEFIIWGIPPQGKTETILLSEQYGISSKKEAEYFMGKLINKGCKDVRLQELKFDNNLGFDKVTNL